MSTLESWMPRDLEIASKYIAQAQTLRNVLAESGSQSLLSMADNLTRSTVEFGRCELHMHVADRSAALNSKAAGASESKRAMKYHARGLQELGTVKPHVTKFSEEVSAVDEREVQKIWKGIEPGIKASWVEALGDLDMKPSDAEKLSRVMDQCCAEARKGLKGLSKHISKQFDELERARKSPSRGTEDNWPYWKLVAVAIWLGMTVAGVILALTRGAQWWEVGMIILIGLIGTLLLVFGC